MLDHIRLLIASALLISATITWGNDGKSFSKQMNDIKRSGDYVYAESSAPNEADAKAACDALLKIEITKYLVSLGSQSHTDGRIIKNIAEYDREYLVQPRGDIIRVFGFVTKESISAAKNDSPKKKSPPTEVKKEETHKSDEPTEPAKATDDAADLPKISPETTYTEIASTDVPAAEPVTRSDASHLNAENLQLAKWQLDMLENIVHEPDMIQSKKLLNRYKNQNRIKRLGDKSVSNPRPEDSFYLIYNSSGKPIALLAPSLTGNHYDMLSGTTVNFDNYKGNQFLWFQISK